MKSAFVSAMFILVAFPCCAGTPAKRFVNHCERAVTTYAAGKNAPYEYRSVSGVAFGSAYPKESVRWQPSRAPYKDQLASFVGKTLCLKGAYSIAHAEAKQQNPDVRVFSASSGDACVLSGQGPLACPTKNGWDLAVRD